MRRLKRDQNFRAKAVAALSVTPERAAKGAFGFEAVETDEGRDTGERRVRFQDASPLDAYLRRKMIDWRQHDAGSWFSRAYRRTVRSGPVASSFSERIQCSLSVEGPYHGSSAEIQRAFLRASLAYTDPLDGSFRLNVPGRVVVSVCGFEEWAGGTRNLGRLRDALDRLADALLIGKRR
jgi:hypothetical protein